MGRENNISLQIGLKSTNRPLLPPKLRGYLYVTRPFTLLPAFMVGLFGALIVGLGALTAVIFGIMLVAFQASGQALNQANPTEVLIDILNGKTYRPTVSGVLSIREVRNLAYVLVVIGVISGYIIGAFLPSLAMGALAILYSQRPFYLKRFFPLGLIVQAFARGMLPIFTLGYISHVYTLPLAIFFFFWLVGLQSTKDFQDITGDLQYGIKTLPALLGKGTAQFVMLLITVLDYGYAIYIGLWHLIFIFPLDLMAIILVNRTSVRWENNYAWVSMYTSLGVGTIIGLLQIV